VSGEQPQGSASGDFYEPADGLYWPEVPDEESDDFKLALYTAQLDVRKKRADAEIARAAAMVQADLARDQEYYQAIFGVAASSIDRARSSAETMQKAAAAVVTIYTGIVGVSFSITDRSLPSRALFPAFFLALAIVLSTVFLAYLPSKPGSERRIDGQNQGKRPTGPRGQLLTDRFVLWCRESALRRVGWLHSSIVALAIAVVFLPVAFVNVGSELQGDSGQSWIWWLAFGCGIVLVVLLPRLFRGQSES
jgi:hypothetical protein